MRRPTIQAGPNPMSHCYTPHDIVTQSLWSLSQLGHKLVQGSKCYPPRNYIAMVLLMPSRFEKEKQIWAKFISSWVPIQLFFTLPKQNKCFYFSSRLCRNVIYFLKICWFDEGFSLTRNKLLVTLFTSNKIHFSPEIADIGSQRGCRRVMMQTELIKKSIKRVIFLLFVKLI